MATGNPSGRSPELQTLGSRRTSHGIPSTTIDHRPYQKRSSAVPIVHPSLGQDVTCLQYEGTTSKLIRTGRSLQGLQEKPYGVSTDDNQVSSSSSIESTSKSGEMGPHDRTAYTRSSPSSRPLQYAHRVFGRSRDTHDDQSLWMPDVHARSFIPEALLAVNFSSAYIVESKPVPTVDYFHYISDFAGSRFLRPLVPPTLVSPSAQEGPELDAIPLTSKTYAKFFHSLLLEEFKARGLEADSYNLFKVAIKPHDVRENIYTLHIPGLREGNPRLGLGDYVCLRQLRLDNNSSLPQGMDSWLRPGGGRTQGSMAPGFTGIQQNACVWGVDKAKETVRIRMDGFVHPDLVFNVVFCAQPRNIEVAIRAIIDADQQLGGTEDSIVSKQIYVEGKSASGQPRFDSSSALEMGSSVGPNNNGPVSMEGGKYESPKSTQESSAQEWRCRSQHNKWMERMLFPAMGDTVTQFRLSQGIFQQHWFDKELNYEQMQAIDSIQQQKYGNIPFLISGPPGTGKTKSVVEAALQMLSGTVGNESHILLCAPSDPAADTLASRIKIELPNPSHLFRLNHSSRTFAEVPAELLPYCHIEKDMFSLPRFERLMGYKVIVTTCRDASMLVEARVTNRDLFLLESGIATTIHPVNGPKPTRLHWTALLVDEAAQGLEPEVMIPLTVVAPPGEDSNDIRKPIVVMAGDQYQLGPRTSSGDKRLGKSLFERLFDRPVYRDHPMARKSGAVSGLKTAPVRPVTSSMLPMPRPAFANLIRNYRSHPAILAIPNALYYHDTLVPEAPDTRLLQTWKGWRGRGWPMLFACNEGSDDRDVDGGGWYNRREAQKACEYAQSLVASELIEQADVCIMSPFRAQVTVLRRMIRAEPYQLHGVNIGPMEAFQGLESRCVIICTTRARSRYLGEDHARGLGVIEEPKRFNVAVTRAKQGLIVIGNPWLLGQDMAWRRLMEFCWRHEMWEAEDGHDEPTGGPAPSKAEAAPMRGPWKPEDGAATSGISRLEKALIQRDEGLDYNLAAMAKLSVSDEDAMWTSGLEAEARVREEWPGEGR